MTPYAFIILAGVLLASFQIYHWRQRSPIQQRYVQVIEIGPNAPPKTYVVVERGE